MKKKYKVLKTMNIEHTQQRDLSYAHKFMHSKTQNLYNFNLYELKCILIDTSHPLNRMYFRFDTESVQYMT